MNYKKIFFFSFILSLGLGVFFYVTMAPTPTKNGEPVPSGWFVPERNQLIKIMKETEKTMKETELAINDARKGGKDTNKIIQGTAKEIEETTKKFKLLLATFKEYLPPLIKTFTYVGYALVVVLAIVAFKKGSDIYLDHHYPNRYRPMVQNSDKS